MSKAEERSLKAYPVVKVKVKVVATKSMVIDSDKWDEILSEEGIYEPFEEFYIQQYVKGCLIEDLRNNPNRGYVKIIAKVEE